MSEDTRLLTSTEVAALAGVSTNVVSRAVHDGTLKYEMRAGVSYLFARAEVERWIEERKKSRRRQAL